MIALVDCNNFYASCERLFRPELRNKPIVVLSNNDGCVIARSNESKALGIAMGVPIFKIRGVIHTHQIQVFSLVQLPLKLETKFGLVVLEGLIESLASSTDNS